MKKEIAYVVCFGMSAHFVIAGETPSFEGTWRLTGAISNGKKVDDKKVGEKKIALNFKDGKYAFVLVGMDGDVGTYKLDAKAKPAHIDLTVTEGPGKGRKSLGILKLEADQLTLAFQRPADARPKDFEGGQKTEVYTFKRIK